MEREGLNDAAVAAKVEGLSRSQINRIRRGASRPTPDTARKLEALTGISAGAFVLGEAGASNDSAQQDAAAA